MPRLFFLREVCAVSRIGAVICLAGTLLFGFGAWFALEQRFGLRTRLIRRFPVLRVKPWAAIGVLLAAILLLGFLFLVLHVPEVAYYITGGLLTVSLAVLICGRNE